MRETFLRASGNEKSAEALKDVPWSQRKELLQTTLQKHLNGMPVDSVKVEARRGLGFMSPNAEIYATKAGKNIFDEDESYVCVSHMMTVPCPIGENHLVSNWPSDVAKVLDTIKNPQ
jgi:hypothetical protein